MDSSDVRLVVLTKRERGTTSRAVFEETWAGWGGKGRKVRGLRK